MTFNGFSVLAVVPARGGSKAIPRKNLCMISGLSLVGHVGQLCRDINWIDKAIISTDEQEIADEALRFGLKRPFLRPPHLAHDTALSIDVWRHALINAENYYEQQFDITILLEPTSPLRTKTDIERTVEKASSDRCSAAATVSATSPSYTPHKTLVCSEEGKLAFFIKDGGQYSIRQRIPSFYHRNGICYALRREALLDQTNYHIVDRDCYAVIIDRPLINIDEPFDLEYAEWLFRRQQSRRIEE